MSKVIFPLFSLFLAVACSTSFRLMDSSLTPLPETQEGSNFLPGKP